MFVSFIFGTSKMYSSFQQKETYTTSSVLTNPRESGIFPVNLFPSKSLRQVYILGVSVNIAGLQKQSSNRGGFTSSQVDQGHLRAEESVGDRTRQLVLVEVTAEKHSEEQIKPGRFG